MCNPAGLEVDLTRSRAGITCIYVDFSPVSFGLFMPVCRRIQSVIWTTRRAARYRSHHNLRAKIETIA